MGGALPGWAWRLRACDVMALPRKGPDIFAMMAGHACQASSREHGDGRLAARHEDAGYAYCSRGLSGSDGETRGRRSGTRWGSGQQSSRAAKAAAPRRTPHLPACQPASPPACHDPSAGETKRANSSPRRRANITQRLCHGHATSAVAEKVGGKRPAVLLMVLEIGVGTQYTTR